ncbi:MAG: nuclear transport factor 2 family protein [Hyphomonadaceae bacterium]
MGVQSSVEMAEAFVSKFNERDGAGLMALYAPDAVFTFDGVTFARGTEQIKAAIDGFLASKMTLRGKYVDEPLVAGDVAMCSLRWEMLNEEGWIDQDGVSVEVLKRGADGLWRFAIDDATGASRERD